MSSPHTSDSIIAKCADAIKDLTLGKVNHQLLAITPEDSFSQEEKRLLQNTQTLITQYAESKQFISALAKGELNQDPPPKNMFLSPFKELHASLRHFMWQIQQVANGQYNQRIDFLGQFSETFNDLVSSLAQMKKIKIALAESEARLRRAELVAKIGNWELHITSNTIVASPGAMRIYGLDRDRLDFATIQNAALPEYRHILTEAYYRLVRFGEPYDIEFKINKLGSGEIVDIHSMAEFDTENRVLFGVIQDISEWKRTEAALQNIQERWQALINTSPDGICMVSMDGIVFFMSEKLAVLHGYDSYEELVGKHMLTFLDEAYHEKAKYLLGEMLKGKYSGPSEYLLIKKDGSRFYMEINAEVLRDEKGNPTSIFFIERDIAERKQAELQLKKYADELFASNAAKDKFFSIIAHDLKSPFQGLLGYSQLLSNDYEELTDAEKKEMVQSIYELSRGTFKLMENLLQWARLQTGKMEFIPSIFNLFNELSQTMELLTQTARKKEISIFNDIPKDLVVFADKNMLQTVIRNLVSNSIKFTGHCGQILISATRLKEYIEITVSDTGLGMDKAKIENLFQIDKNSSTIGTENETGTGLGLLLCKEMIEIHGGNIQVESVVGKGSKFSFTIPAAS